MGRVRKALRNGLQPQTTLIRHHIHAVERYIGDEAIRQKWPIQYVAYDTKKRVLVIGAGPSGLSAAYHPARLGHTVEAYEAGSEPGGLLRTGMPDYRLPKDILDAEVNRIPHGRYHPGEPQGGRRTDRKTSR